MSSKKVDCLFVMRCILTKPHAETEKDPRFIVSYVFTKRKRNDLDRIQGVFSSRKEGNTK